LQNPGCENDCSHWAPADQVVVDSITGFRHGPLRNVACRPYRLRRNCIRGGSSRQRYVGALPEVNDPHAGGQQLPDYQGRLEDVREAILHDAPPATWFEGGTWRPCVVWPITRDEFATATGGGT
jgi:hypothetical protein